MDFQEQIGKIVESISQDEALRKLFQTDPGKAVEKVLGIDLPDGVIEKIIDGVKAKLAGGKLFGAADSFKKLF